MECEKLKKCPFFLKHGVSNPVGCHSFILRYCKGPEQFTCARLEFLKTYGCRPSDDMTPTGALMESKPHEAAPGLCCRAG